VPSAFELARAVVSPSIEEIYRSKLLLVSWGTRLASVMNASHFPSGEKAGL
jgi:hypothetical protein